jgi:D-amino-acid dehydrogenase
VPSATPDVAVVGGGAIGVCVALELARRGADVLLLESGPDLGSGCSAGNAGLLCPSHVEPIATRAALLDGLRWLGSHDSPFALRPRPALLPWLLRFAAACTPARERAAAAATRTLSQASLELHLQLAREHGTGLEQRGTLNVYETEKLYARGLREARENAAAGLANEPLSPAEATGFEPALLGPVAGAIYYPGDLSGDPLAFVQALGRAAADAGADLRTGAEVHALRTRDGRIHELETAIGTVRAGTVVLAAGAWTPRLVRGLGLSVPVEPGKGYHVEYAAATGDPRVPVYLQEARVVATPLPGRLRVAGVLELSGLDLSLSSSRVAAVQRAAERRVRGVAGRTVQSLWSGLRPCPPDGMPIVGRPARYANLVLATGHAMLGFTLAPLTGQLVAELVAGEKPSHDLSLLDPDRFSRTAAGLRARGR